MKTVRRDDEPRIGHFSSRGEERREQHGFIRGPARASDDRQPGAREWRKQSGSSIHVPGACPDLIVAGVAGDDDGIGAYAKGNEALGVLGVDRANRVEGGVGIAKEGSGEARAAR